VFSKRRTSLRGPEDYRTTFADWCARSAGFQPGQQDYEFALADRCARSSIGVQPGQQDYEIRLRGPVFSKRGTSLRAPERTQSAKADFV
jgi:hypothetical protein